MQRKSPSTDRLAPREPPWGWVLFGFGMVMLLLRAMLGLVAYSSSRPSDPGGGEGCRSNMRAMLQAARLYAQDYDGRLPADDRWVDLLLPYQADERRYHCPAVQRTDMFAFGYAFNSGMTQQALAKVTEPARARLIYDSRKTQRNASDPVTSLPSWSRHDRGNVMGFADGHAGYVPGESERLLRQR